MKQIFKYLSLLLLCVFAAQSVFAQDTVKKKLAVYVTGDEIEPSIKKVISAKIGNAINDSKDYIQVETSEEFLKALSKEIDRQLSGDVRNNQIVDLGKRYGVKFVVVADITEVFDEYYIVSKLINLESGLIEKTFDVTGRAESAAQITGLADKLAKGLLGPKVSDSDFQIIVKSSWQ